MFKRVQFPKAVFIKETSDSMAILLLSQMDFRTVAASTRVVTHCKAEVYVQIGRGGISFLTGAGKVKKGRRLGESPENQEDRWALVGWAWGEGS
jgi:hypothetical protein